MMYASLVSSPSGARFVALVGAVFVACALWAAPAVAAEATSAPHTGLEGGHRHAFGPDTEGRRDPRMSMSMPNDAYGNPIFPEVPEKAPRQRLRTGAYGVGARQPDAGRLPDAPGHDAGWNFK